MTLPLIADPEALVQRLGDRQLVVVDVGKQALYNQAHIPGARFLDYGLLVASSGKTHGLLPDRPHLERLLSSLGIDNETHVVACDDEGGGKAARLIWTLHCAVHDKASLLNGGLHAWLNEVFPHTPQQTAVEPADFHYQHNPRPVITGEEILARIDDPGLQLLDARSLAEYNGEQRFALRAGHIPGAINVPVTSLVDDSGRFRPADELAALFESDRDHRAITYCGGGIAASANAFMMTRLGFTDVAVYTASLQEWAADPANPMVVAPGPGQ